MSKYTSDSEDANFSRNTELMRFLCAIANELAEANRLKKLDLKSKLERVTLDLKEIENEA